MCKPGASFRIDAKRLVAARNLLWPASLDPIDGETIEHPAQRHEGILDHHSVGICATAHAQAEPEGRADRRRAPHLRLSPFGDVGGCREIKSVLHQPAAAEG